MSKTYELMTITKADLGEDKAKEISKTIQDNITALKGKVVKDDFWGKRKFSYEIKHNTEGYYSVLEFEIDPIKIIELKSKMNLMSDVVRYLVTAKNS